MLAVHLPHAFNGKALVPCEHNLFGSNENIKQGLRLNLCGVAAILNPPPIRNGFMPGTADEKKLKSINDSVNHVVAGGESRRPTNTAGLHFRGEAL